MMWLLINFSRKECYSLRYSKNYGHFTFCIHSFVTNFFDKKNIVFNDWEKNLIAETVLVRLFLVYSFHNGEGADLVHCLSR